MAYKRPKKEEALKPSKAIKPIYLGSVNDSIESLRSMCNDKSNELIKSIDLGHEKEMEVVFWTSDFAEIIGTATITKDEGGQLSYSLDFSGSTL